MNASWLAAVLAMAGLAGCSGSSLLSTGSTSPATGAPPPPPSPTAKAYAVGTASARAVKCGFNFDPAKLRASFLAAEAATGATPDSLAKVEKSYDLSNATMAKVIANEPGYCSEEKTKYIKADLTRHLAGDFNPGAPHPRKEEEPGLLSFGEGSEYKSPTIP